MMEKISMVYVGIFFAFIAILILMNVAHGYTAPSQDNVTLILGQNAYTAPSSDNVTLILGEVAVDSCTYTSGDWLVQCSDFCNITSPVNVVGDILINGTGTFHTVSDITSTGDITFIGGCDVTCQGGCFT